MNHDLGKYMDNRLALIKSELERQEFLRDFAYATIGNSGLYERQLARTDEVIENLKLDIYAFSKTIAAITN